MRERYLDVARRAIEEGENAMEAAKREVLEETGLHIRVIDLVWHVEEVSPKRGQRLSIIS